MDFYQINDLERLSGVKAHTIRIWEKRHNLIEPYRSETNIRYYDDVQLKKLLNVALLISSGFKISKIALMQENEFKSSLKKLLDHEQVAVQFEYFINEMVYAMLSFDEAYFEQLFQKTVEKFGIETGMLSVIYPFLTKTGVLWRMDEAMPVQEHFATMLIKKKLYQLIAELSSKDSVGKRFLLFLPSNEWHEIPLLFAEYLLRKNGAIVINLGQNVPFVDIDYVIKKIKPHFLMSILTNNEHEKQIDELQILLETQHKKTTCLLGGYLYYLEKYEGKKNIAVLKNPAEMLKFL